VRVRVLRVALLIVGVALYGGPTFAQSAQAPDQPQALSQTVQALDRPQTLSQSSQAPAAKQKAAHPRYSADELYDLGNSYARAGKAGLAVLNYERAALLAPDDPDIRANLEYVRTAAHVPGQPRSRLAWIAEAANPAVAAWMGVLGLASVGVGMVAEE